MQAILLVNELKVSAAAANASVSVVTSSAPSQHSDLPPSLRTHWRTLDTLLVDGLCGVRPRVCVSWSKLRSPLRCVSQAGNQALVRRRRRRRRVFVAHRVVARRLSSSSIARFTSPKSVALLFDALVALSRRLAQEMSPKVVALANMTIFNALILNCIDADNVADVKRFVALVLLATSRLAGLTRARQMESRHIDVNREAYYYMTQRSVKMGDFDGAVAALRRLREQVCPLFARRASSNAIASSSSQSHGSLNDLNLRNFLASAGAHAEYKRLSAVRRARSC